MGASSKVTKSEKVTKKGKAESMIKIELPKAGMVRNTAEDGGVVYTTANGKRELGKRAYEPITFEVETLEAQEQLLAQWVRVAMEHIAKANGITREVLGAPLLVTIQSAKIGKGKARKAAHATFSTAKWGEGIDDEGELINPINELNFSAESLARSGRDIALTVFTEASHAVGHKAGIRTQSKAGRNNPYFRQIATVGGLDVIAGDKESTMHQFTELSTELEAWLESEDAVIKGLDLRDATATFTKFRKADEVKKSDGDTPRQSRKKWACKCEGKTILAPAGIDNLNFNCEDCGSPVMPQ